MWTPPQKAAACTARHTVQRGMLDPGAAAGTPPHPLAGAHARSGVLGASPCSGADRHFLGKAGGGRGALQLGEGSCFADPLLAPVAGTGSGGKVLCCCWGQPG